MKTITVFKGDGIGPEITEAVISVLQAAKAPLDYEFFNVGAAEYEQHGALIPDRAFSSFEKTHILLKSPVTTPVGKGFRSLNVTLRNTYNLYANIRPAKSNIAVPTPNTMPTHVSSAQRTASSFSMPWQATHAPIPWWF